jgi:hypothetical protein
MNNSFVCCIYTWTVSPLDVVLHIPNTSMVHEECPQTSSFPDLPVYHCLAYLDYWSENPFSKIFLLHSGKKMVGIPSSAGSFGLASYPSKLWENLPVVCTGHNTFMLS